MTDESPLSQPADLAKSEPPQTPEPSLVPPEVLDKLPPEARQQIEFSLMQMQMGPMPNPVLRHLNATHIEKALDNAEKADQRQAEAHKEEVRDRKHNRITTWIGIGFVILILGCLWMWVPTEKLGSLKEIVTGLIALGAVGFGGYGFALSKMRDKD